MYFRGTRGDFVAELQEKLIASGYPLPRFGADGALGSETISALEAWAVDSGAPEAEDGLQDHEINGAVEAFLGSVDGFSADDAVDFSRLRRLDVVNHGQSRGNRLWKQIDSIVLHQTGCSLETINRWPQIPIHIGVPRQDWGLGEFLLVHPLKAYLYHANSLNRRSVGIEVEGNFCGLEGNPKTHWAPGGGPDELLDGQIEAARQAVDFIIAKANAHGASIKYILAHRQASAQRIADCGEAIWKAVGLWAIEKHGLSDGGPGHRVGDGYPLPREWTGDGRKNGYWR